jgi:hypothetical protein
MISKALNDLVKKTLHSLHDSSYCKLSYGLKDYQETALVLKAAGHDTTAYELSINETLKAIKNMKSARSNAVACFMRDGILIKTATPD